MPPAQFLRPSERLGLGTCLLATGGDQEAILKEWSAVLEKYRMQ